MPSTTTNYASGRSRLAEAPILVSVTEAADRYRISGATIRRMIRAGQLPARMIGGQYRIDLDDLDALGR